MSKMFIYVLDKFVWLLLIAVLTTQFLQISGMVAAPKTIALGETLQQQLQGKEFGGAYKMPLGAGGNLREKRQAGDRSPLIDNLFNIPIATLTAVSDLVQSSRPVFQRLREAAQKRLEASATSNNAERKVRQQKAPQHTDDHLEEGPLVQADGSSSKVLLRV